MHFIQINNFLIKIYFYMNLILIGKILNLIICENNKFFKSFVGEKVVLTNKTLGNGIIFIKKLYFNLR